MNVFSQFVLFLKITRSSDIARRYLVVNGFDGALTTLGIIVGFYHIGATSIPLVISACFGAAIALGISGLSSGYISESAERKKELQELESAMVTDLAESAHGQAARLIPVVIALVNGLAPFAISLFIISPLWFASSFGDFPLEPLEASIAIALSVIFLLGIFLGKISGRFWLFSGLRTLIIAVITAAIILYLTPA